MGRVHRYMFMSCGIVVGVIVATFAPDPSVAIECGNNRSHNVFMGTKTGNDQLLFMDKAVKSGIFFLTTSSDIASGKLPKNITYIEVIDGNIDGKGGCAYLFNGGVGNNNASFHLKSQAGGGLNFTVKMYGKF
uniref:Putative salivary secreted peptide n=1 Tax=Lygus hesperus TaxID=30085 RepID=A0A0A9YCW0_LYGHE